MQKGGNYINADLKYLNFDFLVEKFGHFDIILMDPPWRIKGGQGNDSAFMFSNSKFNLDYNTMSNQEIMDLGVERLSEKGFIFVWILNTQLNMAYEMIQKWGYEVIDQIIWVKLKDGKVSLSHGYYFMHSFEICLVGYKSPPGKIVEYHSKVSNNIIFAEVRKKS
ncbi:MAG: MT-A70 family methyltransferase [Hyphomonas sp.]|nr:MT-A70 family methyltransferase [Hyphomonas sp.]